MLSTVIHGLRRSGGSLVARAAVSPASYRTALMAPGATRWKHRAAQLGPDADVPAKEHQPKQGAQAAAPSEPAADVQSPEFLAELKEEMEVLKHELCLDRPGSPTTELAVSEDASAAASSSSSSSASADMLAFLTSLRTQEAARNFSLTGIAGKHAGQQPARRDVHMEFPLTPADHPLLGDDFAALPPFAPPPASLKPFDIMSNVLLAHAAAAQPPTSLMFPVNNDSNADAEDSLTPAVAEDAVVVAGSDSLPAPSDLHASSPLPYILGAASTTLAPGGTTSAAEAHGLTLQVMAPRDSAVLAEEILDRTLQVLGEARAYYMTSVLRKRRKKMNKHKLRKLRKRTRSQRK